MPEDAGLVNVYVCDTCTKRTITKNRDAGTTPFLIGCRATPGCPGMAQSSFYRNRQDLTPDVIWIDPTSDELLAFLAAHPGHERAVLEHVAQGGLLDVPAPKRAAVH